MSKLITSAHALPATAQLLNRSHPQQELEVSVKFKMDENFKINVEAATNFIKYVQSTGLAVPTVIDLDSATVKLKSDVQRFETLFGVELNEYSRVSGGTFRHFDGEINLHNDFDSEIIAVLGLSTRFRAKPHYRKFTRNLIGAPAPQSYFPEQLAKLYNFPPGDGTGQVVGIIELGGGYNEDDAKTYAMSRNLPLPNVVVVTVDGAINSPGADPNADGEVMLDAEVVCSIVPKAKVVMYFGPNTAKGFDDVLAFAVNDKVNNPGVISISWGGPEDSFSKMDVNSMSQTFAKAASLGITITAAAGDSGSSDGESGNHDDYPGSDPNVLCCGGTEVFSKNGVITSEVVWNDGQEGGATGGGVSVLFKKPAYQNILIRENKAQRTNMRETPDVAGNASPNSGYNVLVDGQEQTIGGTSGVSPLYAALIALLNSHIGKRVGLFQTFAYNHPKCFKDITQGNNGRYKAIVGYDQCTGLGSPNGQKLLQALKGQKILQALKGSK